MKLNLPALNANTAIPVLKSGALRWNEELILGDPIVRLQNLSGVKLDPAEFGLDPMNIGHVIEHPEGADRGGHVAALNCDGSLVWFDMHEDQWRT